MEITKSSQLAAAASLSNDSSQLATLAPPGVGKGGLVLSLPARELGELARLAHEASGVRQDRVDSVKQRIESGEYQVDLEQLANRLLRL